MTKQMQIDLGMKPTKGAPFGASNGATKRGRGLTETQETNGYTVIRFQLDGCETEGIMDIALVEGTFSATIKASSSVGVVVSVGADGCKGYTLSIESHLGKKGYIVSRWKEVGKKVSEEDVKWKWKKS